MRILYPLLWSRPDRKACREQTMSTAAALARRGHGRHPADAAAGGPIPR